MYRKLLVPMVLAFALGSGTAYAQTQSATTTRAKNKSTTTRKSSARRPAATASMTGRQIVVNGTIFQFVPNVGWVALGTANGPFLQPGQIGTPNSSGPFVQPGQLMQPGQRTPFNSGPFLQPGQISSAPGVFAAPGQLGGTVTNPFTGATNTTPGTNGFVNGTGFGTPFFFGGAPFAFSPFGGVGVFGGGVSPSANLAPTISLPPVGMSGMAGYYNPYAGLAPRNHARINPPDVTYTEGAPALPSAAQRRAPGSGATQPYTTTTAAATPVQVHLAERLQRRMQDQPMTQGRVVQLGATAALVNVNSNGRQQLVRVPASDVYFTMAGRVDSMATAPNLLGIGSAVVVPAPEAPRQLVAGSRQTMRRGAAKSSTRKAHAKRHTKSHTRR